MAVYKYKALYSLFQQVVSELNRLYKKIFLHELVYNGMRPQVLLCIMNYI